MWFFRASLCKSEIEGGSREQPGVVASDAFISLVIAGRLVGAIA